jgi:hypothetical protein
MCRKPGKRYLFALAYLAPFITYRVTLAIAGS